MVREPNSARLKLTREHVLWFTSHEYPIVYHEVLYQVERVLCISECQVLTYMTIIPFKAQLLCSAFESSAFLGSVVPCQPGLSDVFSVSTRHCREILVPLKRR